MTTGYDVIVVGSRVAGASTAMLLARADARVLVVERDAPGTDTLSTHALMRGGVMQLAKWDLLDRVMAADTPPVRRTRFVYGDEEVVVDIKPQHGVDLLCAPRRTVLDPILAAAAREAGAEIRYGTTFQDVLRDADGRVCGAIVDGLPMRAGLVIGADGRRSRVARTVGAGITTSGRNACAYVYAYVAGIADRGYRWHFGRGATGALIPTNDDLHLVFASMPPERLRRGAGRPLADRMMEVQAEMDPGLADEVGAGRLVGPALAFAGAPGFLRRSAGPGWALVGDAGYFKDPATAHGMTDALRDAELLASAVTAGADLARYEDERDALSMPLFRVTDALAGLDWTLDGARALHRDLNQAMKAEQQRMAGPRLEAAA
jgi:menaquinone-9 beta-reductase